MKPQLVVVEWDDATSHDTWECAHEIADCHCLCECKSVGWLHRKNKKEIVLLSTTAEGERHAQRFAIPRGCVTKITKLEV